MSADRLFRSLYASERSAYAWHALANHLAEKIATLPAGSVVREVFAIEAARAAETAEEMEESAEADRDAVIAAGFTPEQYEAWTEKQS